MFAQGGSTRHPHPSDSSYTACAPSTSAWAQSAPKMSAAPQSHLLVLKKRLKPSSGSVPSLGLLVPKPSRGRDSLEHPSAQKGSLPLEPVLGPLRASPERPLWQSHQSLLLPVTLEVHAAERDLLSLLVWYHWWCKKVYSWYSCQWCLPLCVRNSWYHYLPGSHNGCYN